MIDLSSYPAVPMLMVHTATGYAVQRWMIQEGIICTPPDGYEWVTDDGRSFIAQDPATAVFPPPTQE
jgi:hypothetical protein